MMNRNISLRLGLMGLAFVALIVGFHALLIDHAPGLFTAPDADMSYGWFVPLYSLYVLWVERARVRASVGEASLGGLLFTLPLLALAFLGVRGIQIRFEMIAFVGLLIAIPWAIFGRKTAKAILFPALFLLFCLPLSTTLANATERLQALASTVSYLTLHGLGADVVLEGHVVRSAAEGGFATNVAAPCSGLRSLFALMALTAGYSYFNQPTWLRRGLLFACSIPIAIVGNVVRILTVCLVSNYVSKDFGAGTYHDASGFIIFIVAIVLMLAADNAITRVAEALSRRGGDGSPASPSRGEGSSKSPLRGETPRPQNEDAVDAVSHRVGPVPYALAALVVVAMAAQALAPDPEIAPEPKVSLHDVAGFVSEALPPDAADGNIEARVEKRRYADGKGDAFSVVLIVAGASNRAIHRPEQCLDANEVIWTEKRTVNIEGEDWCFETLRDRTGRVTGGFAYTLFNQDGVHTVSPMRHKWVDAWDRSVLNRIDRWVQLRLWTLGADDASIARDVRKVREALR